MRLAVTEPHSTMMIDMWREKVTSEARAELIDRIWNMSDYESTLNKIVQYVQDYGCSVAVATRKILDDEGY